MLQVKKLSLRYPESDIDLLTDISFTLNDGEVLWLKGANGAGKTSLLYAISNVIPQSISCSRTGDIVLYDELMNEVPVNKLIPKISLMLSNPHWELFFSTPEDEIVFALENIGLADAEIKDRVSSVCAAFNLEQFMKFPSNKLSIGWQKMVILAVHAAIMPKVLLLDEPFNGLSETNINRVLDWLKSYLTKGNSVIIAEHSEKVKILNPVILDISK